MRALLIIASTLAACALAALIWIVINVTYFIPYFQLPER